MKDLATIVTELNGRLEGTSLGEFYSRRKAIKPGSRIWQGGLFRQPYDAGKPLEGYAIHQGGRQEIQYNVGFEEGPVFRYGLAFSLEPSQALPDPVGSLQPSIDAFNALAAELSATFEQLRMWAYVDGEKTAVQGVRPIPPGWVTSGNFIFIGVEESVADEQVSGAMLDRAASVLNGLLPFYERVESRLPVTNGTYKVARVCWNTAMWQHPTGPEGKSRANDSYESEHGFGHEEWLFDLSQQLGGWKYGFVQALNHSRNYAGQRIDLLLYAIDDRTKERMWVGAIDSVHALTENESREAIESMRTRGSFDEMIDQLHKLSLDPTPLVKGLSTEPFEIFNLRYRPQDARFFDPPIPFDINTLKAWYYGTFQDVPKSIVRYHDSDADSDSSPERIADESTAGTQRNIAATTSTRTTAASTKAIDLTHKRWQRELQESLPRILPHAIVRAEIPLGQHVVDLYIEHAGKRVIVEIKTNSNVRYAIREALAQLMEYCYWPSGGTPRADALLIVAPGIPDRRDQGYLSFIRDRFNIPVHYLPYREGTVEGISDYMSGLTR